MGRIFPEKVIEKEEKKILAIEDFSVEAIVEALDYLDKGLKPVDIKYKVAHNGNSMPTHVAQQVLSEGRKIVNDTLKHLEQEKTVTSLRSAVKQDNLDIPRGRVDAIIDHLVDKWQGEDQKADIKELKKIISSVETESEPVDGDLKKG